MSNQNYPLAYFGRKITNFFGVLQIYFYVARWHGTAWHGTALRYLKFYVRCLLLFVIYTQQQSQQRQIMVDNLKFYVYPRKILRLPT